MRDAVGGTVNIAIVIFLIALLSGYLAFSVNYTKAFRVKNEIINYIEEYEGMGGANCPNLEEKIMRYIDSQHYDVPLALMNKVKGEYEGLGYTCNTDGGFCVLRKEASSNGSNNKNNSNTSPHGYYYNVVTFVNINVPIIQNIFNELASKFNVKGDTRVIYNAGDRNCF